MTRTLDDLIALENPQIVDRAIEAAALQIKAIDQEQVRADRDTRIIWLHRNGWLHGDIAAQLSLDVGFVREVILAYHRAALDGPGKLYGQMVAGYGRSIWALPAPQDDEEFQVEEIRKAIRAARTYGQAVMITVAVVKEVK